MYTVHPILIRRPSSRHSFRVPVDRTRILTIILIAPLDDDDLEGLLLARLPRFQALLEKSRRSIRAGKGLTHKNFWKAVAQRHKSQTVPKHKNKAA